MKYSWDRFREKKNNKRAIIVFSREPVPNKTKTRLMPYYNAEQCAELHRCFISDIARQVKACDAKVFVFYSDAKPVFLKKTFGRWSEYVEQSGGDLGSRMRNAFEYVFSQGYERAILIGTDIPELEAESLELALSILNEYDAVIGPTRDGGYHLIGMKRVHPELFEVSAYSKSNVLEETLNAAEKAGVKMYIGDEYADVDEPSDIAMLRQRYRDDSSRFELQQSATEQFINETAKISIIVPCYNEESTIGKLIEQLLPIKDCAEIIFSDGGSTDRTKDIICDQFRIIEGAKGRAAQMNLAAMHSKGDILFFLHCDSVLPENFIDEIRRAMRHNEYACFGVKFPSKNFFMWTNRVISNHRAWSRGLPFGDQGIIIDRTLFFEIGMFPELPIMEDYEFGRRLKACGYKPGRTKNRIITSPRRYDKGTLGILKTEYRMWKLRQKYRKGTRIEEIAEQYKDIR